MFTEPHHDVHIQGGSSFAWIRRYAKPWTSVTGCAFTDTRMTAGPVPVTGVRGCRLGRGCSRLRVLGHPLLGLRGLLVRLTFAQLLANS